MAFAVIATWVAKPGEEQRVADAIRRVTPPSRAEEGNLLYQAHTHPQDPQRFTIYEQYVDEQAFETHRSSEHFQKIVVGDVLDRLVERSVTTGATLDV